MVLDALSQALHPEHGSLVMNLHGGGLPTAAQFAALLALLTSCLPFAPQITHSGYHQSTEKGRAVQQITQNLRYMNTKLTRRTNGNAYLRKLAEAHAGLQHLLPDVLNFAGVCCRMVLASIIHWLWNLQGEAVGARRGVCLHTQCAAPVQHCCCCHKRHGCRSCTTSWNWSASCC